MNNIIEKTWELANNSFLSETWKDTVNAVVTVPAWDMDALQKAVNRVFTEEEVDAEEFVYFSAYATATAKAYDYDVARVKAWRVYETANTSAESVLHAMEFAKKRGGDAPTYKLRGEEVDADTMYKHYIDRAGKAYNRYKSMYNADLEKAVNLPAIEWEEDVPATVYNFVDLISFALFGYVKPLTRSNLASVKRATATATAFTLTNAKAGGAKTAETAKAFTEMKDAFIAMFESFAEAGCNIHFNAKEVLYLNSIFGRLTFSIGELKEEGTRDIYVSSPSERETFRDIIRMVLYKMEGHKIGEEFSSDETATA